MVDGARRAKLVCVTAVPITQWAFLRGQNPYLSAQGFEIHAVASPGARLEQLGERDQVATHAIPIARTPALRRDIVSLWRLYRLFRRLRPEIANVSTPKAGLLGALAAWAARVPVRVFLFRGSLAGSVGARPRLFRLLERLTARFCNETICVSPSLLAFARAEGILGPDQGRCLAHGMSNGIDSARFDPSVARTALDDALPAALNLPPDAVVIGCVGRLAHDKGLEELAQAWTSIREEFPQAHLLCVGPWEAEGRGAPAIRSALEGDPRVHLTGGVDDVVPYYRLMTLLVFPSHREGFPNVPMEAAAMALPVIATSAIGCVDAVQDGVTGMLVPARDAQALARAIRHYLQHPELRAAHGRAGRERVLRDFRPEAIWEAMYGEYTRLLRERGLTPPRPATRASAQPT